MEAGAAHDVDVPGTWKPYWRKCGSKAKAALRPRRVIKAKLVASVYENVLSA
jgi:hypothetical protein